METLNSLNLDKLRSYVGDNEREVIEMIELFLQVIPEQKAKLETSLSQQDWSTLNYVSHQIKPSLDIFGLQSAKEKAKIIETLAKTGEEVEIMEKFVTELSLELDTICKDLGIKLKHLTARH